MSNYYIGRLRPPEAEGFWEDLRFPVTAINPPGGASDPTRNSTTGLLEFSASVTNVVAVAVQLPHAWKQGSPIQPYIHWRKKTAGAGNTVWQLEYEFRGIGEVFTGFTTDTLTDGDEDSTAAKHLISGFSDIAMDFASVSVMGIIKLSRLGGDSEDTYAGAAELLEFDIHYQTDAPGSRERYLK